MKILNKYLLDVNILIALTDEQHEHYRLVMTWFEGHGRQDWGMCPFTQAGYLRLATNPKIGRNTIADATEMLGRLSKLPGYRFWTIHLDWLTLAGPFSGRVFGHQQITDAYLLGLAIEEDGVLVTMDKAIRYMAGAKYSDHLLVLE